MAAQLATIKAKSEALRLRQDFELQRFRRKYATSPEAVATGDAAGGGDDVGEATCSDSERSLSVDSNDAFDEPLRVRRPALRWLYHSCALDRHLRIVGRSHALSVHEQRPSRRPSGGGTHVQW